MNGDNITLKLLTIAIIGGACLVASLLVMGLISERQNTHAEAKKEIASKWSARQTLVGPLLISRDTKTGGEIIETYVLPASLQYETSLQPEVRSRGIFKTVVYESTVKVSGEFLAADLRSALPGRQNGTFAVAITDTRGIEKQFDLMWNGKAYAFNPGPGTDFHGSSGLHAVVPIIGNGKIPFSFEIQLKGSEGVSIAPVGRETTLSASSPWPSPKFVGPFLPAEHTITEDGFTAEWRVSSFGRSYPQTWTSGVVGTDALIESAAGVDLHQEVDAYDMVFRSVKYAVLFIVITFAAFFLFDVLGGVRVHPIQYLLVGSALSLFYLLLLSLSEQIGFLPAYLTATAMIALLVGTYSAYVLKSAKRSLPVSALLIALYGALYFVLRLEEYALLFGSLLLFVFLAVLMFTTRNIDWFNVKKES